MQEENCRSTSVFKQTVEGSHCDFQCSLESKTLNAVRLCVNSDNLFPMGYMIIITRCVCQSLNLKQSFNGLWNIDLTFKADLQ